MTTAPEVGVVVGGAVVVARRAYSPANCWLSEAPVLENVIV